MKVQTTEGHIDKGTPWLTEEARKFLGRVLHGYMKHLPFELTEKFPLTPRVCLAIKPGLDIRRNRDDAML